MIGDMAASLTAAGGGKREGAASAAVGKTQACFSRRSGCRAPQTDKKEDGGNKEEEIAFTEESKRRSRSIR